MGEKSPTPPPLFLTGPAFTNGKLNPFLYTENVEHLAKFFSEGKPILTKQSLAQMFTQGGTLAKGPAPISRERLQGKIASLFKDYLRSTDSVPPPDEFDDLLYYLPTRAEVDQVLANRQIRYPVYTPQVFDCEDFAYAAKVEFAYHRAVDPSRGDDFTSFACGLIWADDIPSVGTGSHAVNFIVTADETKGQELLLVDTTPGSRPVMTLPEAQKIADKQQLPRMSIRSMVI